MVNTPDLRLLIVAKDPLTRAGLAAVLSQQDSVSVVGQVAGNNNLLDDIDIYQPELVLFDLGWETDAGLAQLAELQQIDLPVVVLLSDETAVTEVWNAGVQGLLLRNSDAEKIGAALHAAQLWLTVIDPKLVPALRANLPTPDTAELPDPLTPRETEVLQLLAQGLPNKGIALRLQISEHTVKFHVNAIMGKLGAQSRTEAVVRATQLGLILL
jgi:DNA-binding NarL/FixJ family response regulator